MISSVLNILGMVFVLLFIALVIYVVYERWYQHPLRLPIQQATSMIKSGAINKVVDVRTDAEWDNGHYSGAVHLPLAKIDQARMILDIGDSILVYCNTGTRARQAAMKLKEMGYQRVYYIAETYHEL